MNRITYKGFSLIEVMIALVIMAVGLLALSKFHSELFRSTSDAQSRTTALVIAEAKLEDLRSFSKISQPVDGASPPNNIPWSTGADPMSYVYISDDSGGVIAAGVPSIEGNTYTGYTLTWNVTDYWHDFDATPPVDNTAGTGVSDFKQIETIVTWTDEKGVGQQISLMQNISSTSPGGSYLLANASSGSPGPDVEHDPGVAPEVIPTCVSGDCLGTNDGLLKETDNPEPDVSQNEQFSAVSFSEVTYVNGTNIVKKREDFQTVNCACEHAGSTSDAYYPSYIVLEVDDNGDSVITNVDGEITTKRVGTRLDTGQDSQQSEWCDICCRDHHDDASSGEFLYDPFRPNNTTNYPGALSGDHSHYDWGGVLANSAGDEYIEACKMVRVNGLWRVAQDWRQETIKIMPSAFLFTNVIDYQDYVVDVVSDHVTAALSNGSYPQNIIGSLSILDNEPDDHPMDPADEEQMISRSIYIDYMPADLRSELSTNGFDLEIVPFHDINTTKLAIWSSSDTNNASVTSENIEDDNTHSRGNVLAISDATPDPVITVSMRSSNTGLTNTTPVYTPEVASKTDGITLDISAGTTPAPDIELTGSITVSAGSSLSYNATSIDAGAGATACAANGEDPGPTFLYKCDFPANSLVSIELSDYNVTSGAPGNRRNNKVCSSAIMVVTNDSDRTEVTTLSIIYSASDTLNIAIVEDSEACP